MGTESHTTGIVTQKRITSIHSRSRPSIRVGRPGVAKRATDPEPCNYGFTINVS
jgi:hypothetical protein